MRRSGFLSLLCLAVLALAFPVAAQNLVDDVDATINSDMQLVLFWQMDEASMSYVEYEAAGVSGSTERFVSLDGKHSHVVPGALPNATYTYRVIMEGWDGSTTLLVEDTYTTPPMPAPSRVQAMAGDNLAHLGWVPTFGAVQYRVERAPSSNGPWTTVGRVAHTGFLDRNVNNGEEHFYRVYGIDQNGMVSDPSAPVQVLIDPRGGGVVGEIVIPRVSDITIDGSLGDWPGIRSIYIDPTWVSDAIDVDGDADLSGQAYLGYDDDNLYFAVRVTDDVLVFDREGVDIWQTDAVELWLNDAQIGFTRSSSGNDTAYVWSGGLNAANIQVAVAIEENGYTVEAAIPRAEVEKVFPIQSGTAFKLAIGIDDSDVPGAERQGQIYLPRGWVWGDPSSFANAVLD